MAENLIGEKSPRFGKKHTPEARQKMREHATNPSGEANPRWKGGRYRTRGYVMVRESALTPEERETFASMIQQNPTRGAYMAEHRLVAARMLGRPLLSTEHVHHVNGVKDDNRPENLEVHSAEDHKRTHAEVDREVIRLRRENAVLREALSKFCDVNALLDGGTTST